MSERETIRLIFEQWKRADFMQLHAGEMSTAQIRGIRAVLGAVQSEVDDVLRISAQQSRPSEEW